MRGKTEQWAKIKNQNAEKGETTKRKTTKSTVMYRSASPLDVWLIIYQKLLQHKWCHLRLTSAIQHTNQFYSTITGRNILPTQSLLQGHEGESNQLTLAISIIHSMCMLWANGLGKDDCKQEGVLNI